MKRINEIFSDYDAGDNINTAIVKAVIVSEKSKTLEMKISSDKYIQIKEIKALNTFIRERLALNDSKIIVEYSEGTNKKPLEEELKNIVLLLADKYPILRAAINNCKYEIAEDNTITFNFNIAVSYLLKARGYDEIIREAIKNLYGIVCQINFVDKVSNEELKRLKEAAYEKEMLLIQKEVQTTLQSNTPPELPRDAIEKSRK